MGTTIPDFLFTTGFYTRISTPVAILYRFFFD